MLKRLDDILKRYEFLSAQLADPAVISDMGTWQKYSKEHSEIGETAEKYLQYLACEKEMKEAFAQAETEGDKEMRQLFSDEGYACKEKLSAQGNGRNRVYREMLSPQEQARVSSVKK